MLYVFVCVYLFVFVSVCVFVIGNLLMECISRLNLKINRPPLQYCNLFDIIILVHSKQNVHHSNKSIFFLTLEVY